MLVLQPLTQNNVIHEEEGKLVRGEEEVNHRSNHHLKNFRGATAEGLFDDHGAHTRGVMQQHASKKGSWKVLESAL